jgi:Vacuolar protein sorting-associated protein 62
MSDQPDVDDRGEDGEIEFIGRTAAAGDQPFLRIGRTSFYAWVWNDQRSFKPSTIRVNLYRPDPTNSAYKVIGHYAQPNRDAAHGSSLVVEEVNPDPDLPLLAEPVDYQQVWSSEGSWCNFRGSIWRPVPPDNFVVMGHLANSSFEKPPLSAVRCVRAELVEESATAGKIYQDNNTHSRSDFELFSIHGLPGVFISQANWGPPTVQCFRFKMQALA